MKRILSILLSAVMLMSFTACQNNSDSSEVSDSSKTSDENKTDNGDKKKVVYSIPGLSAPIWTAASNGFKEKAAELGWDAEVLDPNDNLETQISQIENAALKNIDGLIITPIDGEAVSTLTTTLDSDGIPVVAIDRQAKGKSIATVEADNFKIGQELGKMFLESLGDEQGKVLIVGGPLSSSATVNRTEGFKDAIKDAANVTIVAESATEMDSEVVLSAVSNYLQANPDINAIFSCTDFILPSIMTALSEADKLTQVGEESHVMVYSVDGDGYGLTKVVEGYIDATYGLDPAKWAEAAIQALQDYFDGKTVDESILVEGNIVTKDSFDDLSSKGLLWGESSMEKTAE